MMNLYHNPIARIAICLMLCLPGLAKGQAKATVDLSCQKYIGGTSSLDRTKYFTLHSQSRNDRELQQFMREYGVHYGRGFWGPFSYANSKTGQVGRYPAFKGGGTARRQVSRYVATEHPRNVIRYNLDQNKAANWVAEYYKNFVDQDGRPFIFEPMNEPFVKADNPPVNNGQPDGAKMRRRMAEWFGAIGRKIGQTPELANMQVVGYASAWPSMELWDFGHWNSRMKMFMDVAGPHMDGFSTHLYDGVNVTGQNNQRAGSNAEAILDLIETYSYAKWGRVKPHAITEYGGIEKGYGPGYSDTKFVQAIRSQNHLLFGLFEREDRMLISIPFNVDKATWHINKNNNYQPYGAALWRPTKVVPTNNPNRPTIEGWAYTSRVVFYRLWQGVQGRRARVFADDPDIQTAAFVSGNRAFVCLNNLEAGNKRVNLSFLSGLGGLRGVTVRRLRIYPNKPYQYTANRQNNAPGSLDMVAGETAVLVYEFNNPIPNTKTVRARNYYTAKHLQPIVANKAIAFAFNGVRAGQGRAVLRMGIGRKHDRSKKPTVRVNGTVVPVPNDWRGYDQRNRTDFFGVIEIPVPSSLVRANNTVSLTFPDGGGHVSTLILHTAFFDGGGGGNGSQTIADGVYFINAVSGNQRLLSRAQEEHNAFMTDPGSWPDQQWAFKHMGDNVYSIKNQATNRYLEVPYGACANNTNVATWTGATGSHQQWKAQAISNGVYAFRPMHCQGRALDRAYGARNANVQLWDFSAGNNNQKWRLAPAVTLRAETGLSATTQSPPYPNPFRASFTLPGLAKGDRIRVYDAKGRKVYDGLADSGGHTVNLAPQPSGLYLAHVVGKGRYTLVKQ